MEEKNGYKVETKSGSCNYELVRSFKIKINKERSLRLIQCEDYLYTTLKVECCVKTFGDCFSNTLTTTTTNKHHQTTNLFSTTQGHRHQADLEMDLNNNP
jgi:hypothetical protein